MIQIAVMRFVRGLETSQIIEETGLSKNPVDYQLKKIKELMEIVSSRNLLTQGFNWLSHHTGHGDQLI